MNNIVGVFFIKYNNGQINICYMFSKDALIRLRERVDYAYETNDRAQNDLMSHLLAVTVIIQSYDDLLHINDRVETYL